MVDYRDSIILKRNFNLEHTIAENAMLKKNNEILVAATILVGVVAIGLTVYYLEQEIQKKYYY
jgi:hypothetical protein